MEIKAIPLKSVNGIKFGMKREEVRKLLGEYEEFKKSVLSTNTTDDFGYCHVYYNKNNEVEAIEIFDADVFVNDEKIYPLELEKTKNIIKDLEICEETLLSKSNSIGIYFENKEMKSILFGIEGYYK